MTPPLEPDTGDLAATSEVPAAVSLFPAMAPRGHPIHASLPLDGTGEEGIPVAQDAPCLLPVSATLVWHD